VGTAIRLLHESSIRDLEIKSANRVLEENSRYRAYACGLFLEPTPSLLNLVITSILQWELVQCNV
jgi:hypothetical protein